MNEYSDTKILSYPEKLSSFQEGRITAPLYVRIKPTNLCNHDCWWCIYAHDWRKRQPRAERHLSTGMHEDMENDDVLPFHKLQETLDDLSVIGTKAITFSGGGEPLIYNNIVDAMELVLFHKMRLSIITNGQALVGKRAEVLCRADWVRVSIDYTNAQQMAQSRGVPEDFFTRVLDNIETFAKVKPSRCTLSVNYVIHRDNYLGIADFAKRLRDLGVNNIRFSPMWCDGFNGYHESIKASVLNELHAAKELANDSFQIHSTYDLDSPTKGIERGCDRCFYMQTVPVVGADQNVYACHHKAYDPLGLIGSIKNQSFEELWYSDEAKAAFQRLNPNQDCRHECANHHKVKLMHEIATAKTDPFV